MTWGPSRLREQGITFVSAGNLQQEDISARAKEHEKTDQRDNPSVESAPLPDLVEAPVATVPAPDSLAARHITSLDPTVPKAVPRRNSISSESSEEILFAGRQNPPMKSAAKVLHTKLKAAPSPELRSIDVVPKTSHGSSSATPAATAQESGSSGLDKFTHILPPLSNNRHPRKQARIPHRRGNLRRRNDDEAIMNDYIANMTLSDSEEDDGVVDNARSVKAGRRTEHLRFYDKAPKSKVNLAPSKQSKEASRRSNKNNQAIDWDSTDLQDFDDFSTMDEEVDEVSQVLRFRTRPSGPQYLVTPSGAVEGNPRWALLEKLKSGSAVEEIRIFKEIQAMKFIGTTGGSDDSDEDELEGDLTDDIASESAENDRIMKHTANMTDEQIARALMKQEELGLGGDEVLLLDGNVDDYDEHEDVESDNFAAGDGFVPFFSKQHMSSRTTSKRNRALRDHFPSASAFADALDQDPYGAFDVMDFERPSLRPKKKSRKSDLPFELGVEDPELAERLRSTWQKDREKKTARKREKQLERDNALLDASERNHPKAIKAEIRQFLIEEFTTSIELAPMDAATRASVHRLAKSLKLDSKSQGKENSGIGRYPVLTKGNHTPRYTIDTIWEIDALLESKKFFPKPGFNSYKARKVPGPGPGRLRRGGAGAMSGATYMNGDVVGASAPELGADNKGRAMLQKMGWSEGVGIGAVGNKGSIDVIKHVVKTTKAGLG